MSKELEIVRWADASQLNGTTLLQVYDGNPLPSPMAHSTATGKGLVTNGKVGADLIRLAKGEGFKPHTHPGDHLLICIGGKGTITYDGKIYETGAGQIYMIEGEVPHAVGAITDHMIMAVGSPHKAVDSLDRMMPVEYQAITASVGDLHCLICDIKAVYPQTLAELGCSHCPSQY